MFSLIRKYPALLAFGILTAAFSSPGQTFLVSLFIPHMRERFVMSQTEIAGYYSVATLLSALILPWMGRLLDRVHLLGFTLAVGIFLAGGCLLLSQAVGVVTVFLGFFLIRNLGQGTMTMISSTTMARIFGSMRGKALGISNLGYPFGEAIFPIAVSSWVLVFGWRSGWGVLACLILFFYLPVMIWLLRKDPHKKAQEDIAAGDLIKEANVTGEYFHRDWTVSEMLRDRKFYLIVFPVLIPPFFFTALFFHQLNLIEWKQWSVQVISAGFIAFGICRALISFLIGPVVDRFTARRVFPLNLFPLGVALLCFLWGDQSYWAFLYLGFAGMTMGLSMTISSALYAEFYGTKELGAIRGVTSSLVVLSTAAAPVIMGVLLDADVPRPWILEVMVGIVFCGIISAWFACRQGERA